MRKDLSYLTSPRRNRPSIPARILNKFAKGRTLDFGCGYGFDANYYGWSKYDKFHFPKYPTGKFDTIFCFYVLNVLDSQRKRDKVLKEIRNFLAKGGIAYIAVRRDKECNNTYRGRGTYQHKVYLKYPVFKETTTYCIYKYRKN